MALFADVLEIKNGKNQKAVEDPSGLYPIFGSGGEMGRANAYLCEAQTVIIGRKGNINNPIFVEEPFWNVDTAFGLVPDKRQLLPRYLFYFCQHFDFTRLNKAVTIPSLTKADLLRIEISLPSIEDQELIVGKLAMVEKLLSVGQSVLSRLDYMIKSRFVEMFENDNCPRVRLDDTADSWFKGSGLKKDQIVDGGQYPCIHYGQLFSSYGPVINRVMARTNYHGARKSLSGDILFPASDVTPHGLTKCSALLQDDVVLGGDIIVLRPRQGVNPAFLSYAIRNQKAQLLKRVTGSLVRHISSNSLKSVDIPMPSNADQSAFVNFTIQIDKSKFAVQQAIEQLELLKASLMQEYFG